MNALPPPHRGRVRLFVAGVLVVFADAVRAKDGIRVVAGVRGREGAAAVDRVGKGA